VFRSKAASGPAALVAGLVALIAGLVLLPSLGAPNRPTWDEAYYLTSTQRYLERTAQFASHPPLGLMLIAAGAALTGDNRGLPVHALAEVKSVAGDHLPAGFSFVGVRLASALCGVVGAVLFFQLMLVLTGRPLAALALSNLYLFENAFIVQFRAAQLDAFQTVFVLLALLILACGVRREATGAKMGAGLDFALGLACGLAAMVRFNGVVLALLGVLLVSRGLWRRRGEVAGWLEAARRGGVMAGGFLTAVAVVFTLHVAISVRPPAPDEPAGRRDAAFVSPTYQAFLAGRRPLSPVVVLAAANDYRRFMAADLAGVPRADPNGSNPLTWPLHAGAINYRWDSDGRTTSYLQLAGNRVGWAIGLLGLVASAGLTVLGGWTSPARRDLAWMLLACHAAFMLLHGVLGLHRVMYLYHYFPGLLLSFALAALAFEELRARWPASVGVRRGLVVVLALHLACFCAYAPLTYHRPLTHRACEWRNLGQTIVACR
jgi:dolichyl-phosphate-mannose--protein O-mannosyl transferase